MAGKLGQWGKRLTGLSSPFVGVSWQSAPAERDIATDLIVFLEDRRVLYTPSYAETPGYCVQSVVEIRRYLTETLHKLGNKGALADDVRAMRIACRHFLDRLHLEGRADYDAMSSFGHWQSWEFQDALGQLRGVVGVHIALFAARFELAVREGLQAILPAEPTRDDLDA